MKQSPKPSHTNLTRLLSVDLSINSIFLLIDLPNQSTYQENREQNKYNVKDHTHQEYWLKYAVTSFRDLILCL